jgi:predicted dehydrogenase
MTSRVQRALAADAPIGVGVVGFGMASRVFHLPTIAAVPGLRLAAVVQRRGDEAAAAYPGVKVLRSVEALLAEGDVELAVVATPNDSHAALAEQCLRGGRHVVVDKPFALTTGEAERLRALSRERGLVLSVFHNRRHDGDFLTVKDLLARGVLGRLVAFEANYDRHRPEVRRRWREQPGEGSGLLYDLGPHLVDQALALFGEPEAIAARVSRERDGAEVDDAFELWLRYPRLAVRLAATMLAAAARPRFFLRGTGGAFVKYGVDPQEAALAGGDRYASPGWGREPAEAWGVLHRTSAEGATVREPVETVPGDYRAYYRDVGAAIRRGGEPAIGADDGGRVLRVIERAIASDRARREVPYRE